jgi:hypothetical protein
MMNKTIESLITAGMIAALATVFFQVAHATDAGSYKFGFAWGSNNGYWLDCTNWNSDCNSDNVACVRNHNNGMANAATNVTSCIIGYVEGWKDWCSNHMIPCAKLTIMAAIPGTLDNNQTMDFCYKTENGWGYDNLKATCHDSDLIKQATAPSPSDNIPVQNSTAIGPGHHFIGSLVAVGPYGHHGDRGTIHLIR